MTPGTYLMKRRLAVGISLNEVARQLTVLHEAIRSPLPGDQSHLWARLAEAEADRDNLTLSQAALVRRIYPFDGTVYEALLMRHYGGAALPLPRVCRACGCSWHDSCVTADGPCAWSDAEPNLCTACETRRATAAQPSPTTEGTPAHG